MSRTLAVVTAALSMVLGLAVAAGANANDYERTVDITFPVGGSSTYIDDYHHDRGGGSRKHQATDIMASSGQPVHAAVGGRITWITGLDGPPPSYGYMITITGDDGLRYNYIHLGTQDGRPEDAYAPGMVSGARVARGQFIGYVGCSGNASCKAPHLHFEIFDPELNDPRIAKAPYTQGYINPYRSLRAAQQRGDVPEALQAVTPRGVPIAGDWNGDGRTTPGWYNNGRVHLRNSASAGRDSLSFSYGRAGDVPIVGDWNGDGRDTIGVIREGRWYLRFTNSGGPADRTFTYGRLTRGDYALAGDWNGDGHDTVGIVRDGQWHLRDVLAGGAADRVFVYGRVRHGDIPVTGDWNRDGADTPGIVRGGEWHLRLVNRGGVADLVFNYGRASDTPVVGDWNGDGRTTPGIVRVATWHLRNQVNGGNAHHVFDY
jgi:hypothetical protein